MDHLGVIRKSSFFEEASKRSVSSHRVTARTAKPLLTAKETMI